MNVGRVIGAIITTIAGLFVLIFSLAVVDLRALSFGDGSAIAWIVNIIFSVLALIGGTIGFTSRTGGETSYIYGFGRGVQLLAVNSLLAEGAGIFSILLGIIGSLGAHLSVIFAQYSLFHYLWNIGPWFGITLEAILMIVGGVIMQIVWEREGRVVAGAPSQKA